MKTYLFSIFLLLIIVSSCNEKEKMNYYLASGPIQGTMYNITYEWSEDLSSEIDSLLQTFNKSLSNYDANSTISRINRNETDIADQLFLEMFYASLEVYNNTDGYFDITIAPIANLWSFGWKNNKANEITKEVIDSLLQYVGMNKVQMQGKYVIKDKPEIQFIGNAIAQGQSVDYVSNYLKGLGVKNFLVEIGGEIYCEGVNSSGSKWRIGIDKPIEESGYDDRQNQAIVILSGKAIATSGNYRKFVEQNGVKFGHSINPVTGYPAENSLLSVTVIADKCILADAYATAFMVTGLHRAIEIVEAEQGIEAYFIYLDGDSPSDYATKGFKDYLPE